MKRSKLIKQRELHTFVVTVDLGTRGQGVVSESQIAERLLRHLVSRCSDATLYALMEAKMGDELDLVSHSTDVTYSGRTIREEQKEVSDA